MNNQTEEAPLGRILRCEAAEAIDKEIQAETLIAQKGGSESVRNAIAELGS
jgi:hypothetical protein